MPTCELRDWSVFAPGNWKGKEYPPLFTELVAHNNHYLRPKYTPFLQIGHGPEQRYARNLGFPRLGEITRVSVHPTDFRLIVDVAGIPLEVGAAINAGLYRTGSADFAPVFTIKPDTFDRDGALVEGPFLFSVALIGAELSTLGELTRLPEAVFADGTPVPPADSVAKWLIAMRDILAGPRGPAKRTVRTIERDAAGLVVSTTEVTVDV